MSPCPCGRCLQMDVTPSPQSPSMCRCHPVPMVIAYRWTSPCPQSHQVCVDVTLSPWPLCTQGHRRIPWSPHTHGCHCHRAHNDVNLSPPSLCTHVSVTFSHVPGAHMDVTSFLWSLHPHGHRLVPASFHTHTDVTLSHGVCVHIGVTLPPWSLHAHRCHFVPCSLHTHGHRVVSKVTMYTWT